MAKVSKIDKVKKLLLKAGSTDSLEEAEALFAAAQKMMVKYRIEESAVEDLESQEIASNEVEFYKRKLEGNWERELAQVIFWKNGCHYTFNKHRKTMQIYGSEQDVQLIKHLFETTRETFRRLAREQYKQTNTSDSKNVFVRSFLIGACRGLNSKIVRMTQDYTREQGNQQEYALMVKTALEKAQAYVSTHVNARQVNSRNSSAGSLAGYMSGIETGKNHSMHIPVESSKTNTKSPKKLC